MTPIAWITLIITVIIICVLEKISYEKKANSEELARFEKSDKKSRVIITTVFQFLFGPIFMHIGIYLLFKTLGTMADTKDELSIFDGSVISMSLIMCGAIAFFDSRAYVKAMKEGYIKPKPRWILMNHVSFFYGTTLISIGAVWSVIDDISWIARNEKFMDDFYGVLTFLVGVIPMNIALYCFFWHRRYFREYREKYTVSNSNSTDLWWQITRLGYVASVISAIAGFII